MVLDQRSLDGFRGFVEEAEPRLNRALCTALGNDVGLDAAAEALAYGWEHWDRVQRLDNPTGYLYRVGRSRIRKQLEWKRRWSGRRPNFPAVATDRLPWVEPRLPQAVARLSEKQRIAVVLVCAFDWTYAEVAELLGVKVTTVQNHLERGLHKLRASLGVVA